jgi:hypothetical protein
VLLRVIWIIDNQSSTQPITVLIFEVTVIPECALKKQRSKPVDTLLHKKGEVLIGPGLESHIQRIRLVQWDTV